MITAAQELQSPVVLLVNATGFFRSTVFAVHLNQGVPMNNLDQMTIDDYFRESVRKGGSRL